jgi:hypothetical protein
MVLETQSRAPAVGVHLDPGRRFQHLDNRAGLGSEAPLLLAELPTLAERVLPLLFLLLMTKSSPFAFKPLLVVPPTIYSVILATMVSRANSRPADH